MLSFRQFLIEVYGYITETAFWPDWARSGSMVTAIRNNTPIAGHVAHVQRHPEYPDEGYHAHILTDGGHIHTFFYSKGVGTPTRGDTIDLYPFLEHIPGTDRAMPSIKLHPGPSDYNTHKEQPEYERYQGRAEDIGTHAETGEPIIGTITGKAAESVFNFYKYLKDELNY